MSLGTGRTLLLLIKWCSPVARQCPAVDPPSNGCPVLSCLPPVTPRRPHVRVTREVSQMPLALAPVPPVRPEGPTQMSSSPAQFPSPHTSSYGAGSVPSSVIQIVSLKLGACTGHSHLFDHANAKHSIVMSVHSMYSWAIMIQDTLSIGVPRRYQRGQCSCERSCVYGS
jgi:hypothetical protein